MVCIEAKVIQRAPANRVGVLIRRKRLRAPGDKVWIAGIHVPRVAAITGISDGAIMRPSGMLRGGMKINIAYINSGSDGNSERLNGAIQVHVKERILVVPHSSIGSSYFVTHVPDAVVTRIRLDLGY